MKTLKSREWVQIRNVAIVVSKSLKAKERAAEKLKKAQEEYDSTLKDIEYQDNFVNTKYGVHIEDVVQRIVTKSVDKDGKEVYKTDFKPTDICVWNEDKKVYEVSLEEPQVEAVIGEATQEFMNPVFDENGEVVSE